MKFKDILSMILVIVVFLALLFSSLLSVGIKNVKDNWPKYKCNPAAMPFAGYLGYDLMGNFTSCIADIQKGLMDRFLKPIYTMIGWITSLAGSMMKSMNNVRGGMFNLKMGTFNMFDGMLGMFANSTIVMQRLMIKLKDLMGKFTGVTAIITYLMKSMSLAGKSTWNGPVGKVIRFVCFHPDTIVSMNNGKSKKIKNITINDTLLNNNKVIATMKIKGNKYSPYYKIFSKQLNNHIYVTGEHLIQDPISNRFIPVSECSIAVKTNIQDDVLSCLVTENHTIPIGEFIFWDWED